MLVTMPVAECCLTKGTKQQVSQHLFSENLLRTSSVKYGTASTKGVGNIIMIKGCHSFCLNVHFKM